MNLYTFLHSLYLQYGMLKTISGLFITAELSTATTKSGYWWLLSACCRTRQQIHCCWTFISLLKGDYTSCWLSACYETYQYVSADEFFLSACYTNVSERLLLTCSFYLFIHNVYYRMYICATPQCVQICTIECTYFSEYGNTTLVLPYVGHQMLNFILICYSSGLG